MKFFLYVAKNHAIVSIIFYYFFFINFNYKEIDLYTNFNHIEKKLCFSSSIINKMSIQKKRQSI